MNTDLLKPLIQFGFKEARLEYNGSGDSGNIEDIEIDYTKHGPSVGKKKYQFNDILTEFCEEILEQHCQGWEIDDGSAGTITVKFDGRNISYNIDHNEYFTDSNNYQYNEKVDLAK